MPMSENDQARLAADNGKSGQVWNFKKKKSFIKVEFDAIEQLADRISVQVSAQNKLAELIPGYQVDPASVRCIRLAANSMHEALVTAERITGEIDQEEFGAAPPRAHTLKGDYGIGLDAIEDLAADIGIQANAQAYALQLIASQRRPNPYALQAMRYMVDLMGTTLAQMGG